MRGGKTRGEHGVWTLGCGPSLEGNGCRVGQQQYYCATVGKVHNSTHTRVRALLYTL
jgi:hypothetical protein